MRVTFEHVEKAIPKGLKINKTYLLNTTIRFSEFERSIIEQRGLHGQTVATGHTGKVPDDEEIKVWRMVRRWAPFAFFIVSAHWLFNPDFEKLSIVAVVFALWAYSWIWLFRNKQSIDPATIVVSDVLQAPTFSFWAPTPFHSKILAFDVRKQLQHIKQVISESEQLGEQETFEL